jgi:hypothetical protein
MKTTWYFENRVLKKRPYLKREWCERVRQNPESTVVEEETGRIRHWAFVEELEELEMPGYLRVVTLEDGETVHNAMPDRNYTRRRRRREG